MRAVLATSIRPRIGQTSLHTPLGRAPAVRRTAFPASLQRLTICDAFTVLLAPVLTVASVVDITHKGRKRKQWDQQLARLLEEIEILNEKELRSWQSLHLRSIQAGVMRQRRYYSTAPNTAARTQHEGETQSPTIDNFPHEHQTGLERYENFLATKVGLQLLLHVCTARDPTSKLNMEALSNETIVPDSLDSLISQLRRVNHGLHTLTQQLPAGTADKLLDTEERRALDARVRTLTWECRTGNISINELVYGYTQAVLKARTGLSLDAYRNLVETFSTLDADAMTFIAMFPYLHTRQALNDRLIANIIMQYGKVKDAGRLNSFVQKLLQPEKSFRTVTKWKPIVVNGVRVPVPVNQRPKLLDVLVRAALQVDQPHKARAWATLLLQQEVSANRIYAVFNNFLTFCAKHVNWEVGQLWIQRAIAYSAWFAEASPAMLSRLVFRILDLCLSCDQHQLYNDILNAAVLAGIDVPAVDETRPDAFADQARSIRNDWASRMKPVQVPLDERGVAFRAAVQFQSEMSRIYSTIHKFVGVTEIDVLRASDTTHEQLSEQPLRKATRSISPDELLPSTLQHQIHGSFEQWKPHSGNEPDSVTSRGSSGESQPVSAFQEDLSRLQEAYATLNEKYELQVETNKAIQSLLDMEFSSGRNFSSSNGHLRELAQKILRFQERDTEYTDHVSDLEKEVESLRANVSDLSLQIEMRNEEKAELSKLNDHFRAQINAVKPKSLEHVFLERENYNMRSELKELTVRYKTVQSSKEYAEREASALRAQYERLEEQSVTKMDFLRQETKALQRELESADTKHQKRLLDEKVRQENLMRLLSISEERAGALRQELSELRSTVQSTSTSVQKVHKTAEKEGDQTTAESENQTPTLSLKFVSS